MYELCIRDIKMNMIQTFDNITKNEALHIIKEFKKHHAWIDKDDYSMNIHDDVKRIFLYIR